MDSEAFERIGRLLGLARRSGAATLGLRATTAGAEQRKLAIVVLAGDASARTARVVRRMCGATPLIQGGTMERLGELMGMPPVAVAGVRHGALAAQILRLTRGSPGEP
ncbi:MAG: ribosomal L7Ae/L30e/S12e/Gadd45 family protein [Candidatus Eisenbacteria bacterium]|nr:ribosomal L7Ae/L30e/S12e/Gadd45 family protein [Candidatus Eisenbacteria bacterium]